MTKRHGITAAALVSGIAASLLLASPAQAATASYPTDGSVCQIGVSLPKKVVIDTDPSVWDFKIQNPNNCDLSGAKIQFEQVKDGFGFQTDMTGDANDVNRTVEYKGSAPYMTFGKTRVTQVNGDYFYAADGSATPNANGVYRLLNHPTTEVRYASKLKTTGISASHGRIAVNTHATRFEFGVFNSKYSAFKNEIVKLQRYGRGAWHTLASAKTNSRGDVTLGAKDPAGKQSYRLVSSTKGIVWGAATKTFKR